MQQSLVWNWFSILATPSCLVGFCILVKACICLLPLCCWLPRPANWSAFLPVSYIPSSCCLLSLHLGTFPVAQNHRFWPLLNIYQFPLFRHYFRPKGRNICAGSEPETMESNRLIYLAWWAPLVTTVSRNSDVFLSPMKFLEESRVLKLL